MLAVPLATRLATLADADSITRVINAAYLVERFFVQGPRITRSQILDLLTKGTFLLVEDMGSVVACVYVEPRLSSGYLGLLSVDPDRQGRGLGTVLLDAAEAHCARAGCDSIEIKVVSLREELPPFYRRRGYVDRGVEPFTDPRATRACQFLLMSKSLGAPER